MEVEVRVTPHIGDVGLKVEVRAEGWLTVFTVFQAKGFTVVVTAAKLQLTAGYSAQKVTVLTVLTVVATTVTTVQKP